MKLFKVRYEAERDPELGEIIVAAKSAAAAKREFARVEEDDSHELLMRARSEDSQAYYIKVIDVKQLEHNRERLDYIKDGKIISQNRR